MNVSMRELCSLWYVLSILCLSLLVRTMMISTDVLREEEQLIKEALE